MSKTTPVLVLSVLTLAGCSKQDVNPTSDWQELPVCKVVFGTASEKVVYIRRSDSELLIHRDGNPASGPESYPMPKKRLGDDIQIAPFKVGDVEYKLTGCNEFIDTEPTDRHSLMIKVDVVDPKTTYSQYCEVELKTDIDSVSIAHFDGPLTIGPQTINYIPDELDIHLGGNPADFRVHVGTLDKTIGCWTVVSVHHGDECRFDEDERPVLTIDFPVADGKKLKRSYTLDEFC